MKKYVEDKIFKDELELWFFLQSLKGQKLEVEDGCYSIQLTETDQGLRYQDTIYHVDRKALRKLTYELVIEFRFVFFVKNQETYGMGIRSPHFRAQEEIQDGTWSLNGYYDALAPMEGPKRHFTEKDFERACEALVEALIVSAKKVS